MIILGIFIIIYKYKIHYYEFVFQSSFIVTKMTIRYFIWTAPLFFVGTGGGPLAKPTEGWKKGRRNNGD